MARQAGPLFITGTVDDMVFYKMGDKYYMRLKGEPTPITKKRMSQAEHYPALCMRKREFTAASQLVKSFYYTLPKAVRKQGVFGTLTGKAVRLRQKGIPDEKIKTLLLQEMLPGEYTAKQTDQEATTGQVVDSKPANQPLEAKPIEQQAQKPKTEKGKKSKRPTETAWVVNREGRLQQVPINKYPLKDVGKKPFDDFRDGEEGLILSLPD